jgi:hypothetical protein
MTTPAYFRDHADRCRRLAGETHSRELAELLLKAAGEYLRLAEGMEKMSPGAQTEHAQQQQ